MNAFRQAAVDFNHFFVDCLRDRSTVLADEHEDRAQHHFAPVVCGGTRAQFTSQANLGYVTHSDGNTTGAAENHIADVVQRLDLPWGPDQILLATLFDITRTHVGVVALQCRHDVLQGDAQRGKSLGYRRDLIFLGKASNRVDFCDARHVTQLRLDDPVLNLAQIGGRIGLAIRLLRTILGFDRPQIDFAQAGRNRTHGRGNSGGQLVARLLYAFVDQLACEVDVCAVLEDHSHL